MKKLLCFVLLSLLAISGAIVTGADREDWQTDSGQIVLVLTADWASPSGTMWRFERGADGWSRKGEPVGVTVGRKGLGLGLGLHSATLKGPQKREGDKRAPAGVFRLESGFGSIAMALPRFPYRESTALNFWVDDPNSRSYNQWVKKDDPHIKVDWKSAEVLRRPDGIYEAAIVVAHNRDPIVPGRGSAIFMHSWYRPGVATIGCTAMEKSEVLTLLRWLDASQKPVLVQAPLELLPRLGLSEAVARLIPSS